MMPMSLSDIANLTIISGINKSEAIYLMQNADLIEKGRIL